MTFSRPFLFVSFFCISLMADEASYGISGNPGAVNTVVGTGALGKFLHVPEKSGIRLGGLWMGDYNFLANGNIPHNRWTGNSLLILDLSIDLNVIGWKGAMIGGEFLQFNGQPTNNQAGVVQGYNSLPGDPPLDRSELYQAWYRQQLFDNRFNFRIGKVVPTYHFNNVSKPVPTDDPTASIPSVSGLIYTPIFVNTTLLGAIGGYYNSVYGIEATVAPTKTSYINLGFFDGNLAKGVQTGLTGPHFNGYYFSIMEVGYGWSQHKPGIAALGGLYQSGKLENFSQTQTGTGGIYAFASQCLWLKHAHEISKGNVSGFIQLGWNNSRTLDMTIFGGAGVTAFSLIPNRPNDSFGAGISWSRLNPHGYSRSSEFMFQSYYQGQLFWSNYFQGDVLEIHILDIKLNDWGYNFLSPSQGIFTKFSKPNIRYFWFNKQNMTTEFSPGICFHLKPFPGIIAVCPPSDWPDGWPVNMKTHMGQPKPNQFNSVPPGPFAGNLDQRDLQIGSVLFVPVFRKGALVWTGDSHAMQSNGEIDVTALETSYESIKFQFFVRKDLTAKGVFEKHKDLRDGEDVLSWPIIETPTEWIFVGLNTDLMEAMKLAARNAINFLVRFQHFSPEESYQFLSMVGSFDIAEAVNVIKNVSVHIPKSIFNGKNQIQTLCKPNPLPFNPPAINESATCDPQKGITVQ